MSRACQMLFGKRHYLTIRGYYPYGDLLRQMILPMSSIILWTVYNIERQGLRMEWITGLKTRMLGS